MVANDARRRRLLITSVGSLVGQDILDGLAHVRGDYFVVGLNSQADAVSNFLCDRVYLTAPLAKASDFEARFQDIVLRESPDLIIPGRDDDVVFLARWAAAQSPGSARVMVGTAAMADVLRDKWLSSQFAKCHGLPFVETLCAQDGIDAVLGLTRQYGWPLVAKPRTGSASQGVVLVTRSDELAVAFEWDAYCFQRWLGPVPDLKSIRNSLRGGVPIGWSMPGIEYLGLHGCIAPSGTISQLFCTRHSESKLGRAERVEVMHSWLANGVLESYAQKLAAEGWRGPFNIQLGETTSGDILAFELNGRFTGSSATLGHLGLHFVPSAIASFVGLDDSVLLSRTAVPRVDKRLRDWPMSDAAIGSLNQFGAWAVNEE